MSIVVSDASPLFALDLLGRLELLPRYYNEVLVPEAVARELALARPPRRMLSVEGHPFLIIRPVVSTDLVAQLQRSLDPGESEAIALALETPGCQLLIDERLGRQEARARGVSTIGVLGVLLRARLEGGLESLSAEMDRLRAELSFRISDELYERLRREAGE